jgi:hypothetical protein
MDADKLRLLIEDDALGLLTVKPKQANGLTEDERLVESFYEIADFYRQQGREPDNDLANMQEAKLAMRLSSLRKDTEKAKALIDLDEFGLLVPVKQPESIDDILKDDALNLLGNSEEESIFTLRNVPQNIEAPDYVAQRQPCKDFSRFEPLFKQCHADLQSGKRILRPFVNEQQIQAGEYFILSGIMVYVADVGDKEKKNQKVNARLRCIFENGTEGDLLLRSLARNLYKDGRRITEHEDRLMDDLNNITDEDGQTGFIYILRSLSTAPQITALSDLYKIGFSTVPVKERVKNAPDDPTYLMAPVHILETFECYNLNPQKLELLLHRFFGKVCLDVDVFDRDGKRYTPREWFMAPLPVIEEVIELIISGKIIDYVYDDELKLVSRK